MPGPCSYPNMWSDKRNADGAVCADRTHTGKTNFDRKTGKALRHAQNRAARIEADRRGNHG